MMFGSYDYRIMFPRQRTDKLRVFYPIPLTMLSAGVSRRLPIAAEDAQQAQEEVHEIQE